MHRFPSPRRSLLATLLLGGSTLLATPLAAQEPATPAAEPTPSIAQQPAPAQPSRFRPLFRLGLEGGGDKVVELTYEDGSETTMTAGGGGVFSIGGSWQAWGAGAKGLDLQATVGVKYRTIPEATNQSGSWVRFPVEGLLLFRTPVGLRLGGGVTAHLGNELEMSGDVANGSLGFDATPGFLLQGEYVRGNIGFDLRYTKLEYRASGSNGTLDASSFGGGLSIYWDRKTARR